MAGDGRVSGGRRSARGRVPSSARAGRSLGAALLAAVALVALVACGGPTPERVRPLADEHQRSSGPAEVAAAPTVPTTGPTTSPATGPAPAPPPTSDDTGATVRAVLDRYDRVVTSLHDDPAALLRPGDPLLEEWTAVMTPGTVLVEDVRAGVVGRLERHERIAVGAEELAYVHHATSTRPDGTDRIGFTWCGWSPGIVTDVVTGAVVDDGVAATRGTGLVERTGAAWTLSSLDQLAIEVLPPGSPDPCPAGPTVP